ncbi:MAG TPA: hypothetical protein VHB01_06290 [Nitrosospira sp.]|nr:hypothetical protein [Nitrosospira sp.]
MKRQIICFMLIMLASSAVFAQAPGNAETTMKSMISAILANSLPDFVAQGDQAFQEGMTKEMLASINQSLGSRLRQGYTTTFLTRLNQQGFAVYTWKVEFKDGNDDVLVFLALKDGKVGGFWLR